MHLKLCIVPWCMSHSSDKVPGVRFEIRRIDLPGRLRATYADFVEPGGGRHHGVKDRVMDLPFIGARLGNATAGLEGNVQRVDREFGDGAKDALDSSDIVMVSMHHPFHRSIFDEVLIREVDHISIVVINPARDRTIDIFVCIAMHMMAHLNQDAPQLPSLDEALHDDLP